MARATKLHGLLITSLKMQRLKRSSVRAVASPAARI
jgi:hypothetical protein